jgi:hypothetical protein
MGTIRNAWDDVYPVPMVRLMRILARSIRGGKNSRWPMISARRTIFKGFKRDGYQVEINKPKRLPSGDWHRPMRAAIVAQEGLHIISVDFCSKKPEKAAIERLAASPGVKVLVLTDSGPYKPWEDRRSPWHRVGPQELGQLDYLIGSRTVEVKPQTPAEIARGYIEHDADPIPILEMIDAAWRRGYPMSAHRNCYEYAGNRYLPQLLVDEHDMHPKAAVKLIKDLRAQGLLTLGKHRGMLLRGLKLTPAGHGLIDKTRGDQDA